VTRDHQKPYSLGVSQQNRRGILFIDDMESPTPYEITGNGTDYSVVNTTDAKYFRLQGLRLTTKATTPAGDDWVQIRKQMAFPESGQCVARFRLGIPDISTVYRIYISLIQVNGVTKEMAQIIYSPTGKKLSYINSAGASVEIPGYGFTVVDGFWSIFQLSIDVDLKEFLEVFFMGIRTSLAGHGMRFIENDQDITVGLDVKVSAYGAAQAIIDLDSLYVGEFERI